MAIGHEAKRMYAKIDGLVYYVRGYVSVYNYMYMEYMNYIHKKYCLELLIYRHSLENLKLMFATIW